MTHQALRKAFGERVRTLREGSGKSQEGFAHEFEFGRSYYGRVERGEVNVSLDNIGRLAEALGVAPAELFHFGKPRRPT